METTSRMAAVDHFDFLLRELERTCSNARDILAILGVLYGCRKSLQVIAGLCKVANDHLLTKLSFIGDFRKRFGSWAGTFA